jgi:hypothetical protein
VIYSDMIGKIFTKVERTRHNHEDRLVFHEADGTRHEFYHSQDCCESVNIEDICGELSDLEGAFFCMAEETINRGSDDEHESFTWTFYKFATTKGYVTVRWFGHSNGYYGEGVSYRRKTCKPACTHPDWADCEDE